nr:uncharacterized protein CTRU02_10394 [Colletotrichum truncatum]KAF6787131.1 hypothetical protein CTRU02_10394 [Colletotrichum truncatum]
MKQAPNSRPYNGPYAYSTELASHTKYIQLRYRWLWMHTSPRSHYMTSRFNQCQVS